MSDVSYYNSERYPDPTAYAGLTAAIKAEKAMHFKPVVYICSPYSGNTRLNTANARRYCRYAVDKHSDFRPPSALCRIPLAVWDP
uniref:DUF7768 domain-containing protein n=1 Tax=Ruminococcus bicirculans (ex Wegman et al. 2014) TaxID=1160721 RepID=UPI004029CC7A